MSKLTENLIRELNEIQPGQIAYGSKVALKQLKKDNIEKIYLTLDCPLEIEQKLCESKASVNIVKLDITKDILKEMCKVPFNVSVLSILKAKIKEKSGEKQEKTGEKQGKEKKTKE